MTRRPAAGDLGVDGFQVARRRIGDRPCLGRIELDQHIAGLHVLAVLHVNGLDGAGIERLDQLGAAVGLHPAGRHRMDVQLGKDAPHQGGGEHQADGPQDGDGHRRRRRLQDLDMGGKELLRVAVEREPLEAALQPAEHARRLRRQLRWKGFDFCAHAAASSPACIRQSLPYTLSGLAKSSTCDPSSTIRPS